MSCLLLFNKLIFCLFVSGMFLISPSDVSPCSIHWTNCGNVCLHISLLFRLPATDSTNEWQIDWHRYRRRYRMERSYWSSLVNFALKMLAFRNVTQCHWVNGWTVFGMPNCEDEARETSNKVMPLKGWYKFPLSLSFRGGWQNRRKQICFCVSVAQ